MRTLPDYLEPGLAVVSVGLNPSPVSVRAGWYFANPRNRFWRALNASGLLAAPVEPGPGVHELVLARERIGFTDVVKRSTASASSLRAADFRRHAPRLARSLEAFAPRIAWFHGRLAWDGFARAVLGGAVAGDWGEQPVRVAGAVVFVSPNPSPANAAFSLDALIAHYRDLARLRERVQPPGARAPSTR